MGNSLSNCLFSLKTVSRKDIEKEILKLNVAKDSQDSDIPTKIIKKNSDIFSDILFKEFKKSLEICKFPSCLKMGNVTPVYKNGNRSDKDNYRPVSILSNLSKIFESCLCKQISTFFEDFLSKYQCEFRKGHSAQHCLLALIEKWKQSVDHGKAFQMLLTDLSKAFDCRLHSLFIAKLKAYGFDNNSLKLVNDYLPRRFQRIQIGNDYCSSLYVLIMSRTRFRVNPHSIVA